MTLNSLPVRSAGRQPRALIRIAGAIVPTPVSFEVSNNSHFEADTFRVSFAASALPDDKNAAWFAMQKEIFIEVLAGFPTNPDRPDASELSSLIYGRVDDISYDPLERTVELTGRDLTAVFIDNKLAEQYVNRTASDVATLLAQSHGLTPVVTSTTETVGTYYKRDEVRLQANRSEWDLLTWLAREEGFIVYVKGQELHFEANPRDTSDPYEIRWQRPTSDQGSPSSNAIDIKFSRSLTVAKGITVVARSASLTKKTPVVESYPSAARAIQAGKASPFGEVQAYYFTLPAGKNPTQVQAYAKLRYDEIIAHEMKATIRMPADDLVGIRTPLRLSVTGTAFDQVYFPRSISRFMSLDEGYEMRIEAQNQNPDTVPNS